jgi:hypothetical protein
MIEQNVSLQPYNTFGLTAKAKLLSRVTDVPTLQAVLSDSTVKNEERFILGGGSNILLTKDINALVVKNEIGGIELEYEDSDSFRIKSGAGVVWHDLVMHCIANGYAGIENLSLIPGNVGGMLAEFMNVPYISLASSLEVNGDSATMDRTIEGGVEVVEVKMPFVASTSKGMAEQRIPNMRGIMAARTKPLSVVPASGADAKTAYVKYGLPDAKSEVKLVDAENMDELVNLLHTEAKVI